MNRHPYLRRPVAPTPAKGLTWPDKEPPSHASPPFLDTRIALTDGPCPVKKGQGLIASCLEHRRRGVPQSPSPSALPLLVNFDL